MQTYIVLLVLISLYFVSVQSDISGSIPYQSSCDPSTNAGVCSSNSLCKCAQTTSGVNVCTQQMSCTYSQACDSNDSCAKDGSTCVLDDRCSGERLCYSTALFSPDLCPPLSGSADAKK